MLRKGEIMKIAIFSDIHGNLPALTVILNDIKRKNIDKIVCLGDVIGIGPKPKECLDLVMANDIFMVLGNHEMYALKSLDHDSKNMADHFLWLKQLINQEELAYLKHCEIQKKEVIDNLKISYQHFLIKDINNTNPLYDINILTNGEVNNICRNLDVDYTFIGHEHKAFNLCEDNHHLIDVGSSGCTLDNKTHYTILNIDDKVDIQTIYLEYDRQQLLDDFKNTYYPHSQYCAKSFFGIDLD